MFGQSGQLGVGARRGQDLCITGCDRASAFTLKGVSDDRCPTAEPATADDLVDELHEIIWEPDCNLLAHTKMVPLWDQIDENRPATQPWFRRL
jgi:hypothetical protein